ncbi:hypothetical protein ACWC9T_18580 [Kitasatospora sp. NPDC001159]
MTTAIGTLLLAAWAWWAVRHLAAYARRCPPLARLAGPRAAARAAERRLDHLLTTRQIDQAAYQHGKGDDGGDGGGQGGVMVAALARRACHQAVSMWMAKTPSRSWSRARPGG